MESSCKHRKRPRANPSVAEEEETARRVASSKHLSVGGIYVPPQHRARAAAANHDDDDDMLGYHYQRRSWDALRKSITGLVSKATPAHIRRVARELLKENLVHGRSLLCRALVRSQAACPAFMDVFAVLAAAVNSKLPLVGRLLVRLVLLLRRAYTSGDRHRLATAARFVAHLVNQGVAHQLLALELVTLLLLDRATTEDNYVEVAAAFVEECGATLRESCPQGLDAVLDTLRDILHDGNVVDRRVQFIIQDLLALRRAQFGGHPPMRLEIELDNQKTHRIELLYHEDGRDHQMDLEYHLDVFNPSSSFARDEAAYEALRRSMLGEDGDKGERIQSDAEEEPNCNDDEESEEADVVICCDEIETDLWRCVYLTVMSSIDSEEAGHKLLSVVRPGQETELYAMLVECCSKERTYTRYYGQLGQRLCVIHRAYQAGFEACFAWHYSTLHRVETT